MKTADKFFNDIDFVSIISTIKGIYTSDASLATLLDFERVLDEADTYAFKNWELGELVDGPMVKRYTVTCTFMWPEHLMPDPRAAKRLIVLGCQVFFKFTKIDVPVEVKDYEDFVPGTRFPKVKKRKVVLIQITMPKSLMQEIREGSIDLQGEEIDLQELDDSFEKDLDSEVGENNDQEQGMQSPDQIGQQAPSQNMTPGLPA